MADTKLLESIARRLKGSKPEQVRAIIGFDGFVDEVVYLVDKRYDKDRYDRIRYLADYGKKVCDATGLSINIEMVPVKKKLGGNGPIFANSLAKHGFQVTYIGALGKENIHPVFEELKEKSELISISDPGFTDAIEFLDGKIISSKLETLKDVNWESLKEKMGVAGLAGLLDQADFIGFENWTLIVKMTGVWNGIIEEVFPLMKNTKRRKLFIDLADPEKRTAEDIMEAIECLEKFEQKFEVILGLNEKEAYEFTGLFGYQKGDFQNILEVAELLKNRIHISTIVIHPVKEAGAIGDEGSFIVKGPYCREPRLTTGAGDNFNAGFMLGQMLGFNLEESLAIGTANSGFYVRKARSASFDELQNFIIDWSKHALD